MNPLYLFLILAGVVLQIVIIAKFFEIASDLRELRKHFVTKKEMTTITAHKTVAPNANIPEYVYKDDVVVFADGLKGKLSYGLMGYGIGGNRYFGDKEEAVKALYEKLSKEKS